MGQQCSGSLRAFQSISGDNLAKTLKRRISVIPANPGSSPGQKLESGYFKYLKILSTPVSTGVTTFYENISGNLDNFRWTIALLLLWKIGINFLGEVGNGGTRMRQDSRRRFVDREVFTKRYRSAICPAVFRRNGLQQPDSLPYGLRGWEPETGMPSHKKLVELGLTDIADELLKLSKIPRS
jgi:hypothetical protein